jgi:hypothetical protein
MNNSSVISIVSPHVNIYSHGNSPVSISAGFLQTLWNAAFRVLRTIGQGSIQAGGVPHPTRHVSYPVP